MAEAPPAHAIRVDSTLVTWVTTNPDTGEQEGHFAFIADPEPDPAPACRWTLTKVLLALAAVFVGLPLLPVTGPVGVVAFIVWRRRRAART